MRIAFFVRKFPSLSETFILSQITGLMDRGHRVVVVSERPPDPGPVHEVVETYRLRERVVYLDGPEGDGSAGATLSVLTAGARLARRAPHALAALRKDRAAPFGGRMSLLHRLATLTGAARQVDVIHAHFGDVALRSRFANFLWRAPFVASFYGYDCSRLPRQRGEDVYRPLVSAVDRVTVLSDHMRRRLLALGFPDHRLREHHIGVDPDAFAFRPRGEVADGPVRLLTVARLVEKKGVEYALRALATAIGKGADLQYVVIGDGPLRPELEALAGEVGVGSRVEFRGSADQAEVRSALRAADLFVLPSVTASDGDEEGTPTVLMEASASGLPVLSTRHAGIPEVVVDGVTGRLVPERDAETLAEALEELLAERGRWTEMGRAGREHIRERYNARRLVADLEALYREVGAAGTGSALSAGADAGSSISDGASAPTHV